MAVLPALERTASMSAPIRKAPAAAPRPRRPEFAYLLNADDSSISQFAITETGILTPLSPPKVKIEGGLFPQWMAHIAADPSGRHLYMTNARAEAVTQFSVAPDGRLSLLPTAAQFSLHADPEEIIVDPSGRFAYVSLYRTSTIATFPIGANGLLAPTPVHTISYGAAGEETRLSLDASARLLFVRGGDNETETYRIGQDGLLVPLSRPKPNLSQPMAFDPSGRFAFYGDGSGAVWQFLLSPQGVISENTPRSVPADQRPEWVVVHPNGHFAYAANGGDFYGDGSISQYKLNSDGRLTALSPVSVMTGTSPDVLVMDTSGRFLYTFNTHRHSPSAPAHMNTPEHLNEFRINTDGTVTAIGVIDAGQEPLAMVIVHPQGGP